MILVGLFIMLAGCLVPFIPERHANLVATLAMTTLGIFVTLVGIETA